MEKWTKRQANNMSKFSLFLELIALTFTGIELAIRFKSGPMPINQTGILIFRVSCASVGSLMLFIMITMCMNKGKKVYAYKKDADLSFSSGWLMWLHIVFALKVFATAACLASGYLAIKENGTRNIPLIAPIIGMRIVLPLFTLPLYYFHYQFGNIDTFQMMGEVLIVDN